MIKNFNSKSFELELTFELCHLKLQFSVPNKCPGFSQWYCSITYSGFLHSDIPGSKYAHNSPRLIAMSYVLHRLQLPRHPPYTLILNLIVKIRNLPVRIFVRG